MMYRIPVFGPKKPSASRIVSTRQFADCAFRRKLVVFVLPCLLVTLSGCADDAATTNLSMPVFPPMQSVKGQPEAAIREVSGDELQELFETCQRPVLVEFSVLSGCYRCDHMRSPIRQKAAELTQQADVVRIDFNLNQKLAREVGATVCPSYVVYCHGRVVSVRTWPTSADFVADDVRQAVEADTFDTASEASASSQPEGPLPCES